MKKGRSKAKAVRTARIWTCVQTTINTGPRFAGGEILVLGSYTEYGEAVKACAEAAVLAAGAPRFREGLLRLVGDDGLEDATPGEGPMPANVAERLLAWLRKTLEEDRCLVVKGGSTITRFDFDENDLVTHEDPVWREWEEE